MQRRRPADLHPGSHALHCEVFRSATQAASKGKSFSLYGKEIEVIFKRRIRAEKTVSGCAGAAAANCADLARQSFTEKLIFRYNSAT